LKHLDSSDDLNVLNYLNYLNAHYDCYPI
jgi:hypothetical protein